MWTVLVNKLLLLRDQCIPAVRPTPNCRERPPWINKDILQLVKQKHKSYRRWKKNKTAVNYQKYCKKRNKATAAIRQAVKHHEKNLTNNLKTDPKSFWKYVKSKTSCPKKVGSLRTDAGEFETDEEKAEVLNESFAKVFTNEDTAESQLLNLKTAILNVPMDKININEELIFNKI